LPRLQISRQRILATCRATSQKSAETTPTWEFGEDFEDFEAFEVFEVFEDFEATTKTTTPGLKAWHLFSCA
jgi:hypothetical protein